MLRFQFTLETLRFLDALRELISSFVSLCKLDILDLHVVERMQRRGEVEIVLDTNLLEERDGSLDGLPLVVLEDLEGRKPEEDKNIRKRQQRNVFNNRINVQRRNRVLF